MRVELEALDGTAVLLGGGDQGVAVRRSVSRIRCIVVPALCLPGRFDKLLRIVQLQRAVLQRSRNDAVRVIASGQAPRNVVESEAGACQQCLEAFEIHYRLTWNPW